MNKRTLTIVLALILLACFFLPYFTDGSDKFSAFTIVFGNGKIEGANGAQRYIWLMIPISALVLLFGGTRFTNGFAFWFPLLGLLYIVLSIFIAVTALYSAGDAFDVLLKSATYGYWISLVAAVILPFSKSRN